MWPVEKITELNKKESVYEKSATQLIYIGQKCDEELRNEDYFVDERARTD